MIDDLIQDAVRRMDKSVETTQHEFNTIRTGRASAALLDHVAVDYYGTPTPLNQLSTINVARAADADDPAVRPELGRRRSRRRCMESDLGLTPSNDGKIIRLPIPQLTEERRRDLVKVVRQRAEDGRVAVRNVRRDVMHHLKELVEQRRRRQPTTSTAPRNASRS